MQKSLILDGQTIQVTLLEQSPGYLRFQWEGEVYHYRLASREGGAFVLQQGGKQLSGYVGMADRDGQSRVWVGGQEHLLGLPSRRRGRQEEAGGSTRAPLSGLVAAVKVVEGDRVTKGTPLVVMEAMKMQLVIAAPEDGVVKQLLVKAGDQVTEGTQLVIVEAKDAA